MINQKENKQVRMGFWLLKLLSREKKTKTKNKDQPTNNHKKYRKIKALKNITPTMDYYPRN